MGKSWPGCCDRNDYYSSPNLCQLLADQAEKKQRNYAELLHLVQSRIADKQSLDEPIRGEVLLNPPLHRTSCDDYYLPITQLLLQHSADGNATNYHRDTPLHYAAENICLKTLQCLIEKKANPDALGHFERTPLYLICDPSNDTYDTSKERKRVLAATLLLKAGANPNIKSLGATPLHELIGFPFKRYTFQNALMNSKGHEIFIKNRKELIKLLLDHSGDLSITNSRDQTPLEKADYHHPACSQENMNNCKELANFAIEYLNDSRKKLVAGMMTPLKSSTFSPFMKLPKELVKMIVFMVYPSHKKISKSA